jgi:hypothetical protein
MLMSRSSLVRAIALLALVLATAASWPLPSLAQDDEARFDEALASREAATSLAGPRSGELEQAVGFVTSQGAGVETGSFVASATFANPSPAGSVPWDIGFVFHRTPDAVQQVVVDSSGNWYYSPWPAGTQQSGSVAFDASPGGSNTLDLVVDGSTALFALNGEFLTSVQLPPPEAADVEVATGVFNTTTEAGRVIPYSEFQVWPLMPASGGAEPATPEPGSAETTPLIPPLAELLNPGGTPQAVTTPPTIPTPTPTPDTPTPPTVSDDDAKRFATILAGQDALTPVAGPFTANLKESPDFIALSYANVDMADFHAHAVVTVPNDTSGVPWDAGFRFRYNDGDYRITVNSLGLWNFAVATALPEQSGSLSNLAANPGEENTLDLLVAGQRAWLGLNGELVATIDLPGGSASDVALGAGFFADEIVTDRVTFFRDFTVRDLAPGAFAGQEEAGTPPAESTPTAADDREAFSDYLASLEQTPPTAGPFAGSLEAATAETVPMTPAGVNLGDFVAAATVTNPSDPDEGLWDAGFQFRTTESARHRVVIDSLGDVYADLAGGGTTKIGNALWYNANPDARNTVQIVVFGNRALFGVNNQFVAAVALPDTLGTGDVSLGAGFFREDFVMGRVTDYQDFSVWELS